MAIKMQRDGSVRLNEVEFELDRQGKETREKLSGKMLKKEIEKDNQLIGRHRRGRR